MTSNFAKAALDEKAPAVAKMAMAGRRRHKVHFVIPMKMGIQYFFLPIMDSRLRGNDRTRED